MAVRGAAWCKGGESLAPRRFPWYGVIMETSPFELTPEQKGMLASLSRETGKPMATLLAAIAAALEELQEREQAAQAQDEANGHETEPPAPQEASLPIWERIRQTFNNLSEEDLASLPVDGAAQVDHYAYGLPKR
jgi:predicted DNA-binding protein